MKKFSWEISKVNGKTYHEILVDGKGVSGTYVFEIALETFLRYKTKLEFPKRSKVKHGK